MTCVYSLTTMHLSAADHRQREQSVVGSTTDGSTSVVVSVEGVGGEPGSKRDYLAPVTYSGEAQPGKEGKFTQPVRYNLGMNTVTVRSGTKQETTTAFYSMAAPLLRVRLQWAGRDLDYDLYVNDINYTNKESRGGSLSRDAYAVSNNDGSGGEGEGKEEITYRQAAPGMYAIYVNYYSDHDNGHAARTTVTVELGGKTIFTDSKILSEHESLGSSLAGNGKSVWNVGTVIIHGEKAGGYQVMNDRWQLASLGWRDFYFGQDNKPFVFADGKPGVVPVTSYTIEKLTGPNGVGAVVIGKGMSAQFTASGIVNFGSGKNTEARTILGKFQSSQPVTGTIDELGVFTGQQIGKTVISTEEPY